MTYQPIDTARKDGKWILLRGRNTAGRPMIPVVAAWRAGFHGGDDFGWWSSCGKNVNNLASYGEADWHPLPDEDAPSPSGGDLMDGNGSQ